MITSDKGRAPMFVAKLDQINVINGASQHGKAVLHLGFVVGMDVINRQTRVRHRAIGHT